MIQCNTTNGSVIMSEISQRRREDCASPPRVLGDVFARSAARDLTVTVCHGPYLEELPVGNMSVGVIRERFGDRLDIDPESQAVVDGHEVEENTIVRAGQLLTFVRKAGEKGV